MGITRESQDFSAALQEVSEGNVCRGGLQQGRLATWMFEAFAPLFHFQIKPINFIALPSVQ